MLSVYSVRMCVCFLFCLLFSFFTIFLWSHLYLSVNTEIRFSARRKWKAEKNDLSASMVEWKGREHRTHISKQVKKRCMQFWWISVEYGCVGVCVCLYARMNPIKQFFERFVHQRENNKNLCDVMCIFFAFVSCSLRVFMNVLLKLVMLKFVANVCISRSQHPFISPHWLVIIKQIINSMEHRPYACNICIHSLVCVDFFPLHFFLSFSSSFLLHFVRFF